MPKASINATRRYHCKKSCLQTFEKVKQRINHYRNHHKNHSGNVSVQDTQESFDAADNSMNMRKYYML